MIESHPYIAVLIVGAAMFFTGGLFGLVISGLCQMAKDADESEQDTSSIKSQFWLEQRNWGQN
jgi:hypothetical protein